MTHQQRANQQNAAYLSSNSVIPSIASSDRTNSDFASNDRTSSELTSSDRTVEQSACVDIYVAKHCFVCEYSHEVAEFIREQFPHVLIRMIDITDPQADIPEAVFATPTYLLNGKLWSLGNPSNEDVINKLAPPE